MLLRLANFATIAAFIVGFCIYIFGSQATDFSDPGNLVLWLMIVITMFGVATGNLYTIIVPTVITTLVLQKDHDKANGLFGTVTDISFAFNFFCKWIY